MKTTSNVTKQLKTKPDAKAITLANLASGKPLTKRQQQDAKIIEQDADAQVADMAGKAARLAEIEQDADDETIQKPTSAKQRTRKADQTAADVKQARLNKRQTDGMAKALDIPPEDVAKHVKIVVPLDSGYHGPMLALRARLKAGSYAKAENGQPCCGDKVSVTLGRLKPDEVIRACCIAMAITNPYLHLNVGQQSMNLRNKLRGALKRNEFGMGVLHEAIEEVLEGRPVQEAKDTKGAAAV